MIANGLAADLRHALRCLRKEPGFAVLSVLMLGLGLGATCAVFSLVNGVLLKPLPYAQPERLASVYEVIPRVAHLYPHLPVNARHFVEWRTQCPAMGTQCPAMEGMSAFNSGTMNLTGSGEPLRLQARYVSPNLLRVLGVHPARGRDFRDDEEKEGNDGVVMIADGLWRRQFQADPNLVGRTITLNGRARTVIGILPADFRFMGSATFVGHASNPDTDLLVPNVFTQDELKDLLGRHNYGVIARLRPGATWQQAVSQMQVVQRHMEELAGQKQELRTDVEPLLETVAGKARRGLMVLMGAIAALLLIVCVNLANLLLARSERHSREFAVRAALGASRTELIRRGLAEAVLVAIAGGVLAVGVARGGIALLRAYAPPDLPRLDEVALDGRVLLFSVLLVAATALLFGFLPAWRASRSDPQDTLRSSTRSSTSSRGGVRVRSVLVASEVGLSATLLILAGTLLHSFVRLMQADKGFQAQTVLAVGVGLSGQSYKQDTARDNFYRRVLGSLESQGNVESAAIVSLLPLQGETWVDGVSTGVDQSHEVQVNVRFISADYFRTMGIPLPAGRTFRDDDRGKLRTIISKKLAAALWPEQDPVGRKFTRGNDQWYEVIGVAGDVRSEAQDTPVAIMYRAYWEFAPSRMTLVARARGDARSIAGTVRTAIHAADPGVPVPKMETMSDVLDENISLRRFQMLLASGFALMALVVASFGIYAVVSYSVARRTAELGIRAALGAGSGNLYGLILRQGMAPVIAGLVVAAAGAVAFGRVLESMLYEIGGRDPLTIATVAGLLGAVATAACLIPARRASRVDPLTALRYE